MIKGCDRSYSSQGYCRLHWDRKRKNLKMRVRALSDRNHIEIKGDIAIIDLYNIHSRKKGEAVIDAADVPLVKDYKWCQSGNYVQRVRPTRLTLQELLMGQKYVSHIDKDGLNNRRSNLQQCTGSTTQYRRAKTKNKTTSKYKGVCWVKNRKVWMASVCKDYTNHHLGYFDDEVEAAKAYDQKAKELFGELAYLNRDVHDLGMVNEQ